MGLLRNVEPYPHKVCMRQQRFFSSESAHGSETSHGFANDTIVLVFDGKQARNKYVERSRNLSCQAIRASEATREPANVRRPRPFSSECWIIRVLVHPDWTDWGCIGVLEIGSTMGYGSNLERFYR